MGINPSLPAPKGPPIPRPRPKRPPRPEDLPNAVFTDERFKSVQQRITGPKPDLPPPFTDERFRGALLAGHRRQLEGMLDPIAEKTDASVLNFSPEVRDLGLYGESWDAENTPKQFFDRLRGLVDDSIEPISREERVYRTFFKRNPHLLEEKDGTVEGFATFDQRGGNVTPEMITKATAGFFERAYDWVIGDHKINREERRILTEGMTDDWLRMMVKGHEMRHQTFNQDKYRKFLVERGFYPNDPESTKRRSRRFGGMSREEELNRAMDWVYAPQVMKAAVLKQQIEEDGLLNRYKEEKRTPKFLANIYRYFFISTIRAMEQL